MYLCCDVPVFLYTSFVTYLVCYILVLWYTCVVIYLCCYIPGLLYTCVVTYLCCYIPVLWSTCVVIHLVCYIPVSWCSFVVIYLCYYIPSLLYACVVMYLCCYTPGLLYTWFVIYPWAIPGDSAWQGQSGKAQRQWPLHIKRETTIVSKTQEQTSKIRLIFHKIGCLLSYILVTFELHFPPWGILGHDRITGGCNGPFF